MTCTTCPTANLCPKTFDPGQAARCAQELAEEAQRRARRSQNPTRRWIRQGTVYHEQDVLY